MPDSEVLRRPARNLTRTLLEIEDQVVARSILRTRRAELERAINELEFDIRELCEKQKRALTLVHQIEELITEESA